MRASAGFAPEDGATYAADTMLPSDNDADLMLRYRDGDGAAFAALYAHYKGPLYRYLLRHVRNACAAADL